MSSTQLGFYLNTRAWWFGVMALVIGTVCLTTAYCIQAEPKDVLDSMDSASVATIIQKVERSDSVGGKLRPMYSLRYQFVDDNGIEYQGVADVAESTWKQCRLGESLPIRYSRNDPTQNQAAFHQSAERQPVTLGLSVAGAVMIAGGGLLATIALCRAVRRMRVVRSGDPHIARVTEKLPARGGQAMQIGYAFTDGRGIARDGQTQALPNRIACLWNLGDPILVLSRRDDVLHHEADVCGARAADLARLLTGNQG